MDGLDPYIIHQGTRQEDTTETIDNTEGWGQKAHVLVATTEAEHQVESGLLLDVVISEVGKGAAVLQLLAGEDQTLLVRRNALLILDLGLHVVDGVRRLHLKGDRLARQGLHEDLHASP
ncbi:hypothetical protein DsansV1_C26g0195431 [Dioscorea sansibarensis]